ncbi:HDOD domain-containing protein [Zavarzinella formosa]|uniref:HDOD domain-containing protein n=1 Tax=Zavarzinella formosa TaxID=360055 RepID=UPI00031604D1|nr:HDOD domain-containing protein [Zavarzinella formosa]
MSFGIFKRAVKEAASPVKQVAETPATLSDMMKAIKQLPSLSETVIRAMALANDENYRFKELVDVMKRDGAMTSLMLKVANSVVYGSTKPVETVDQAVIRIGMIQCNRLITTVGMKGALKPKNPDVANRINILWRHSLLTGFVATHLNAKLGLGFTGQEYTGALLHDIGRIVFLLTNEKMAKRVDPLTFRESPDILAREREMIGTDHCELGMEYSLRQNLPANLTQVIRYHHIPLGADINNRTLTDLVCAADHLTNYALSERRVSDYDFKSNPSFKRLLEKQSPDFVEAFPNCIVRVIKAATKETREALRVSDF